MKQVIEITQPKLFIAENVKGLVNLENVKKLFKTIFHQLEAMVILF
jgi:DNA (cytosine-5)-methyltransferase 1